MSSCRFFGIALAAAAASVLAGCKHTGIWPGATGLTAQHGDEYTILLYMLNDPTSHVKDAELYRREAEKDTGWKGLFVTSKADHSELCWGRYPTIEAAQKNLKKAKAYVAPAGMKIFAQAMVVPLPGEDVGPPEWKLENAPGFYSVLVAVFYDVPDANYVGRKDFAVQYCKQLRDQGREAYYHHGPNRSGVTVGSFPESAIETVQQDGKDKSVVVSGRMKGIMDEFGVLAVNGLKELVTVPVGKKRVVRFDPKLWGPTEEEARQRMKMAAKGYHVVDQRPYPVRVPVKEGSHAPSTDGRAGDSQPR